MDYNFFIKDVGLIDFDQLKPLADRIVELYSEETTIARFNVKVRGLTYQQDTQVDRMVGALQAMLTSWSIPDLGGNPLVPYYTVNWIEKGGVLPEHSDLANGFSFDDLWTHKIHIPLVTNRATTFHFRRNLNDAPTTEHLALGRVYVYNNACMHKVNNPGDARAHLILYARDQRMFSYYRTTKIHSLLNAVEDPVNHQ